MIPFFILIFMGIVLLMIHQNRRAKRYKDEIVLNVLEEMFDDFEYQHEGFSESRIFDTKLVPRGNRFYSSDYLRANYKGINFEFSDVKVQQHTQTGKTSTTVTYFMGHWLVVKAPYPINGRLYIIDKQLGSNPRGFIFTDKNLEKLEFESIRFNKEFKVYAEDDLEAYRIVNPKKMLNMLDYCDHDVSFYQNRDELHIAIYNDKDILEPKLFKDFNYEEERIRIKDALMNVLEYLEIFEIVDKH